MNKTSIDWLSFRTKTNPFDSMDAMAPIFGSAHDLVKFVPGLKGRDGWERGGDIMLAGDLRLGCMDYAGEHQRGWVRIQLTGEGCGWVQDWAKAEKLPEVLGESDIKRLDIALTTFKGEITDRTVTQAHKRGAFSSGGRPPAMKSISSSDPRAGKTRYIGTRAGADKFLRCYEKGFEMISKVPETWRKNVTEVDGNKVEDIYRVELELKAVNNYIPWTALETKRDDAFAGAYPWLAELLPLAQPWKMQALPDFKAKTALPTQLEHCRIAYGGALRMALDIYGADQLLAMIVGDKPSKVLIAAGVLTVDHG